MPRLTTKNPRTGRTKTTSYRSKSAARTAASKARSGGRSAKVKYVKGKSYTA